MPLITCVTTLAKGKTDPDHQNLVRDDRSFGGTWPAALYRARATGGKSIPSAISSSNGILQAAAYSGNNPLFQETATAK
ncbi:MAG: hypothetical protein EOS11_04740 [Mesorhizobium sp.]|nr:MAG: hypothetical protein EOS11_04740 [Mesorhizobium sp.]